METTQNPGRIPSLKPPAAKDMIAFLEAARAKYGKEAVIQMNDEIATRKHAVIPSGSLRLDQALGGGWPFARIMEVYGGEGSGKTTTALHAIASVQKHGGTAALIDAEHSFSAPYATVLGVDVPALIVSQPKSGEEALNLVKDFADSRMFNIIVVDSIAALTPQAELDGEIGDVKVGAHARMMSSALKKLVAAIDNGSNCIGFFTNQIRMKIGGYGNPEETPGGKALKFYASIRMEVRAGDKLKDKDGVPYGQKAKVTVKKNKLYPPFKTAELDLIYGKGFWALGELLDMAVDSGYVQKSGAWYSFKEEKIGQGRDAAATALEAKGIRQEIEELVRKELL